MSPNKTTTMSVSMKSQIQEILSNFLIECDIKFPREVVLDQTYRDACYADATRRGFDLPLLSKSLDVGIAIGDTSYRHLKNYSTRVFIAVWTGLLAHIDDHYAGYADGLREFSNRFMRQEKQMYPVLDNLVEMTREFGDHWGTIGANIIFGAELDFVTSTIIDGAIEGMDVECKMAPGFPQFTRRMSGVSRGYAVQAFPPELDVKEWIQVIPDLWHFIDHANDLLSFYKEELDGESVNFISMNAKANGISKIEALKQLADATAESYKRGAQLLESCPEALSAYQGCGVGYIAFHSLSRVRYKLNHLDL
ncbi:hypothetical protein D9756_010548 [Leucocoprinus leucothites]|uniref:Trichodiene synthase n=1 Tax=Leucocoprinus leucothites TaxID=201217 RepID=A0A8H5CRZ1_9AGAR|nr:hypothetical protein D9756_010548 [Leucoagaricus leucothites]